MVWSHFLHFYQPIDQQRDIIEAVVAQSYRPLFEGFLKIPKARLTLNVTGALLELLDLHGHTDLIDALRTLGQNGQAEFTGSAKYHAFLPFLSAEEATRQITANAETLSFYLGKAYKPAGFFPPEMAYDEDLPKLVESLGFKWIILDEIAHSGYTRAVDYTKIYRIEGTSLRVFFRERRPSNLIMSALVRSEQSLAEAFKKDLESSRYLITAMDGETFGHHHPGLEKTLFEVLGSERFSTVRMSDLLEMYPEEAAILPVASTWASSREDIEKGIQFLSWNDPENPLHQWQWQLTDLALKKVSALDEKDPSYPALRLAMDQALASDHFWWASAKPWWSLEMIELGANRLLHLIRLLPNISEEEKQQASKTYEQIITTAFEWQRSGKIREMAKARNLANRIPLKDRTWALGGESGATYKAFLDMLEQLEQKAASKGEYEQSIAWRDARWRIEHKTDIYEAINAIDLLRVELGNEEVEKILKQYHDEYHRIRGGQPEDRF